MIETITQILLYKNVNSIAIIIAILSVLGYLLSTKYKFIEIQLTSAFLVVCTSQLLLLNNFEITEYYENKLSKNTKLLSVKSRIKILDLYTKFEKNGDISMLEASALEIIIDKEMRKINGN